MFSMSLQNRLHLDNKNKTYKLEKVSMTSASILYACIYLMLALHFIYTFVYISKNFRRKYDSFTDITNGIPTTTDSHFSSYFQTLNHKRTLYSGFVKINQARKNTKHCFHISLGLNTLTKLIKNPDIGSETGRHASKKTQYSSKRKMGTLHSNGDSILCNRFVTIARQRGRIGNQMFEIASLIGTAYTYDAIPVIPKWFKLNNYFDLPNRVDTKMNRFENVITCKCRHSAVFYNCSKEFSYQTNVSMDGYLQSWKYFENAKDIIRETFKFKSKHLINAKRILDNVTVAGYQRVCIHVRRRDFISKRRWHLVAGLDYIEKAKTIFINKYSRVQFLVVSDDKPWCHKNLKDMVISPFHDPGDDMALMTLSEHVIVTAGTFGWWGAWLCGGTVVYYNTFARPEIRFWSGLNKEDYFPNTWKGIS